MFSSRWPFSASLRHSAWGKLISHQEISGKVNFLSSDAMQIVDGGGRAEMRSTDLSLDTGLPSRAVHSRRLNLIAGERMFR